MQMPEPMGKLDTVTVNGPEGEVLDWDAVDWRRVEDNVRRLRQRLFTRACLNRLPGKRHGRFLGGPGAATRRGYPTIGRSMCCRPAERMCIWRIHWESKGSGTGE